MQEANLGQVLRYWGCARADAWRATVRSLKGWFGLFPVSSAFAGAYLLYQANPSSAVKEILAAGLGALGGGLIASLVTFGAKLVRVPASLDVSQKAELARFKPARDAADRLADLFSDGSDIFARTGLESGEEWLAAYQAWDSRVKDTAEALLPRWLATKITVIGPHRPEVVARIFPGMGSHFALLEQRLRRLKEVMDVVGDQTIVAPEDGS